MLSLEVDDCALNCTGINFSYGEKLILNDVSLSNIKAGDLTVLLGPNAAGKSTLFKSLAGLNSSTIESFSIGDSDYASLLMTTKGRKQLNREVCYMPQDFSSNASITVFEAILLARKNLHCSGFDFAASEQDLKKVERQIYDFKLQEIASSPLSQLSGGQQQLASICQALVREPKCLLLDEPTSALDLGRQHQVLKLIKSAIQQRSIVSLVALHDLALAARYADNIVLMNKGSVVMIGSPDEVFSSGLIEKIYGVALELIKDSQGRLVIVSDTD